MRSFLSDKVYEVLKWIALVAIPALGEAYIRLADAWNLPYAQQINETALVVTFILGAIIGVSTIQYNKNTSFDIEKMGVQLEDLMENIAQKEEKEEE